MLVYLRDGYVLFANGCGGNLRIPFQAHLFFVEADRLFSSLRRWSNPQVNCEASGPAVNRTFCVRST